MQIATIQYCLLGIGHSYGDFGLYCAIYLKVTNIYRSQFSALQQIEKKLNL